MMDLNGIKEFVAECDALAAKYGPRFKPNALLRDLAAKGDTFYGRFSAAKKKAA
jgi:3-hydroxyacyl-CoA dehydrogenase/enoyl-CoA hydratase/3-hydroxybutyryl-CoA epimerase